MGKLDQIAFARYAAIAVVALASAAGSAQTYPTKPIRFVIGFAPGGASDIVSRIIGEKLAESLGQPVVIDNRPAATGSAAAGLVAKSPADGYTMLCAATSTLAVNPSLYSRLPYDSLRDFSPVAQFVSMPNLLVVNPAVPARTVSELINLARAEGGKLAYASAGVASSNHMAAELFNHMTRIKMVHVPYKGGGPAVTALLGNEVPVLFATIVSVVPHVKSGRLRPLGLTGSIRSPTLPDVPTIAEAGVPGYESTIWYGAVLPAGAPKPVVARLNAEIGKILNLADVRARFIALGAEPVVRTADEFTQYIRAEMKKWDSVVKQAGIRAE